MNEWEVLDDNTVYLDAEGNPTKPGSKGGVFGMGATKPTKYRKVVYANGQVWTSVDDAPLAYSKTDAQVAAQFRANKAEKPSPPILKEDAQGNPYRYDPANDAFAPVPGMPPQRQAPTVREDSQGNLQQYNPTTQMWEPAPGMPAKQSTPDLKQGPDGNWYQFDKGKGWIPAPGMPTRQKDSPYESASVIAAQISAATQAKRLEWDQEMDRLKQAIDERRITLDEAKAKAEEKYNQINADLAKERNAIAREQNQITQRGQNLSYASDMAKTGVNAAMESLPYLAPKGSLDNFNKALAGLGSGGYAPVEYGPQPVGEFPFDPTDLGFQLAARALASISPAAALAMGVPVGVQNGFTPPAPASPAPPMPTFAPPMPMPPSIGGSTA